MRYTFISIISSLVLLITMMPSESAAQEVGNWPIHSMSRPQPPVLDPGPFPASAPPPSDAIVLFDGRSLDRWRSADSAAAPARWTVRDGYVEVAPGAGSIATAQGFGDAQLHIEWSTPSPAHGEGQERGNSGVIFMGRYEVQVLDSYHSATYPDGQAGAIYGQYPPLVNASRAPGEWQTYDIVFHAPRFAADGHLLQPARFIVLHNGVLVQDDVVLTGPTAHQHRPPYEKHPGRLPLVLQNHGDPVRYRNIWLRELHEPAR